MLVKAFDPQKFNSASSLQDNLLFGKIAYGRPQAEQQVRVALSQVLQDFGLIEATVDIGREIDPQHYQAVAAAIRFAEAMRAKARARG